MSKCDFCDNECVGYTSYQLNLYCKDHEEIALDNEKQFWNEIEQIEVQND